MLKPEKEIPSGTADLEINSFHQFLTMQCGNPLFSALPFLLQRVLSKSSEKNQKIL